MHMPELQYALDKGSDPGYFPRSLALLDNATALNQQLWARVKNELLAGFTVAILKVPESVAFSLVPPAPRTPIAGDRSTWCRTRSGKHSASYSA